MKIGLEVFLSKHTDAYKGEKIGLLTNSTGVNHQLVSAIDLFAEHKTLMLTALYGPEHGIRGMRKKESGFHLLLIPIQIYLSIVYIMKIKIQTKRC